MGNLNNTASVAHWVSSQYCATGKVRQINEDSVLAKNSEHLWVVADGMGGHDNGDYASQYVIESLSSFRCANGSTANVGAIDQHLSICNTHLIKKAKQEAKEVIGCTVAALLLQQDQAWCVWSGDSRIYRLRNSELSLLTRDHNIASLETSSDLSQQQFELITDMSIHGEVLTSAIGGDDSLQTEHSCYPVKPNDEFLLCTDGLYKEVSDDEIAQILASVNTASDSIDTLAALYLSRGARDNVGMIHIYRDTAGDATQ